MSNQLQITGGAKVRNLEGVLTGTAGVVASVPLGGANGVATLDSSGKVPLSQLPASVITYLGTWNASTNTPTLTNGVGDVGDLYICNVAGTVNFGAGPITFAVGDWVIYSGTTWEKSGGASGTVTSVAMTVPTGLSVTGSPITTSGTLAVSLASGYTIPTTSFLSGLVPYTGATGNVNLGEYGLSGGYLGLDTTPTGTPTSVGTLSWDTTYLTPKVVTGTGATTLQIGQEEVILIHNNTGSTLTDGQVVYVTGSTGELPSVSLADASSETTSAATLGVITETIANGANGFATVSGMVHGLNTLAYNEGDLLWLSETAGQFTNVKPISPAHLVLIGYVIKKAGGNGSILVKIQNTQELEECSDVLFTSLANNDILAYESSTDLWKNKTIANVLGYTPANAADYVPYTGATATLDLGLFPLQSFGVNIAGGSGLGGAVNIRQATSHSLWTGGNYTSIYADTSYGLKFYFANDARTFTLSASAISFSSPTTYIMPASSGTLALTSDIPSLANYVTLTGAQTITGIKTFTNEQLFGNGITLTGGYITYTSGSFNLTLNTNILTANRNVFLQDGSGTLAFTSDIPSLSGYVQGSGTTNYISKFTASGTIGNSMLTDDGTTLQSIGATRSNLYLKAASSSYYSQLAFTNGSNGSFGGISYNNSGQYMQFETNSSEWMRLTSNGKLGIGTTSPSSQLQVVGTGTVLRIGEASGTTGKQLLFSIDAADGHSEIASIWQGTSATSLCLNPSGGNVGIGNTSPSYKLDVTGTGRFLTTSTIPLTAETTSGNSGVMIKTSSTTTNWLLGGQYNVGNGFEITPSTAAGGTTFSTPALVVKNTGSVGIGTSSPAAQLDIRSGNTGFRFFTDTDTYAQFNFLANLGLGYDNAGAIRSGQESSNNSFMSFWNKTSGSMTEKMRITSGGSVCIGRTSAPSSAYKAAFQDAIMMAVSTNGNNMINFFNQSDSYVASIVVNSGTVVYGTVSDYRLKEDFKQINGLEKLSKIKVYDFKLKTNGERMDGVIAHELQEIIPYAVTGVKDEKNQDGTDKIQQVDYAKIVPTLIAAIQELKAEIDELKNK